MTGRPRKQRIRLLAVIEGTTVNGPAKNLLEFCRITRDWDEDVIIESSLAIFERVGHNASAAAGANELASRILRDHIPLYRIPERFTFDPKVIGLLKQVVDRVDPDILQTHMFKSHFFVRASGAHKKRHWIAFHHGYTRSTVLRALLAQLDRWSLRAPDRIITVCNAFSRQLQARGIPRARTLVLHNSIDPLWTENPKPILRAGPVSNQRVIVAVGRLSKEKGFKDLILAIRHLRQTRPELELRLFIVGEGRERRSIEQVIVQNRLENEVVLTGHVNDVRSYFQSADLLAISSWSEGSPNVLLEAMAAGVPVVSTSVGGIPDMVQHGKNALLVPPRNSEAMAGAIARILDDTALAASLVRGARKLIKANHSPMERSRALVATYEKLSKRSHLSLEEWSVRASSCLATEGTNTVQPGS